MKQQKKWTPWKSAVGASSLAFAALLVAACSQDPNADTAHVKVQVPWLGADGHYLLGSVPLETVKDLSSFSGDSARIKIDPNLDQDSLSGNDPTFKFFRRDDGTLIPTDSTSLQIATAYAHDEYLWKLDKAVGLGETLSRPRSIGILLSPNTALFHSGMNNAIYVGAIDSLVILSYQGNGLPLSMNGGVLAHEHFHALFERLVLSALPSSGLTGDAAQFLNAPDDFLPERKPYSLASISTTVTAQPVEIADADLSAEELELTNAMVIRGLNEGLADFWGWIYTGLDNFILQSLPSVGETRSLKTAPEKLVSTQTFKRIARDHAKVRGYELDTAYRLGNQVARWMRAWASLDARPSEPALSFDERIAVAKKFMKVLPLLKEKLSLAITQSRVVSPNVLIYSVVEDASVTPPSTGVCDLIKEGVDVTHDEDAERVNSACPATESHEN